MKRLRVLVVCTGNTCRSPLAAAFFRKKAAERGLPIEVSSAGTDAWTGQAATEEAVLVAREAGASLEGHRARRLTPEMVREADLVLTMTRGQRKQVTDLVPSAADKVLTIKEFAYRDAKEWEDVPDPIGQPLSAYRACSALLSEAVDAALDRMAAELQGGDGGAGGAGR